MFIISNLVARFYDRKEIIKTIKEVIYHGNCKKYRIETPDYN